MNLLLLKVYSKYPEILPISRSSFAQYKPVLLARGNSFTQADIYELHYNENPVILKDFFKRPWIIRASIGRFFVYREIKALKKLATISNVPAYLGMVDKYAFMMEKVKGSRLPRKNTAPPSIEFLSSLQNLINKIHSNGVSHNDLRRTNIFIGPNDKPYLIDFATVVFKSDSTGISGMVKNAIFSRCTQADRLKFLKLKHQYYSCLVTDEEQLMLNTKPLYLRFAEFFRKKVYRSFLKPARWKERIYKIKSHL